MPQETTAQLVKELRNARRLFGPDWARRIAAAQALGAHRAGEAVSDLAAVVQESQNPDLVQAALQALGQIGTPQAVDVLITILCGGDVKQRELASQLLVNLGPVVAGRSLLAIAARSSASDRNAAEGVLKRYGDITPLLVILLADSDADVRNVAHERLVKSGTAAVPPLLLALANPSPAVRKAADATIGEFGETTALLVAALQDTDDRLQDVARERLTQMGPDAVPALVKALSADAPGTQETAARALAQIGAPAIPSLATAARQASGPARILLVRALGAIGQPAIDDLTVLMKDPDPLVVQAAAEALGKIGEPALIPLAAILADGEASQAMEAAKALAGLGQPAVPELIDLLGHSSSQTRKLAADVLLRIGGPEVDIMKPALTSWISSATPPRLLVVDTEQGEDSLTLEDCISSATEESILALRPGIHTLHAPISLTQSLILLGAGTDRCVIACAGEQYVIQVVQGRFAASGIAFEHIGPHFGSVIEAAGGEVNLHRCACLGGVFDEIVSEEGVLSYRRFEVLSERFGNEAYLRSSFFEDVLLAGSGLWIHGQAKATTRNCHFTNNVVSGIAAEGDAQVELVGNECNNNQIHGISLCGKTRGRVTENSCHHNKASGIAVRSEVDRTVEELMIDDNTCRANGVAGIGFWQKSIATARSNRCIGEDTQLHGVYASEEAQPEIIDNHCETNQLGGISFYTKATGTTRGNKCRQNKAGIAISDEASPLIEANNCSENVAGIYCESEASPLIRRNTCTRNTEDGISVADAAAPTLEQNVCSNNSRFGILFLDNCRGVARYNKCMENEIGIYITAEANPRLQSNACEGNIIAGIGKQPS